MTVAPLLTVPSAQRFITRAYCPEGMVPRDRIELSTPGFSGQSEPVPPVGFDLRIVPQDALGGTVAHSGWHQVGIKPWVSRGQRLGPPMGGVRRGPSRSRGTTPGVRRRRVA